MNESPTILILAAGRGTRMHSDTPKVLHELCGRPMGLWPVRAAVDAGAGRVVVVDSPERVLEALLPDGVELVVQRHPDGTGGAVRAALAQLRPAVDASRPLVVLSGDVPLVSAAAIEQLVRAHAESRAAATMITTVLEDPTGYGRVVRDAAGLVERVVETKRSEDASATELEIREVNAGIYAFDPQALTAVLPRLQTDNAQGELYLPEALAQLRAEGLPIAARVVQEVGLVLGVNDLAALALVRELAQAQINDRHMLAGVTIVDPRSTQIDADVRIGRDARIEPATRLLGATTVGERAGVGPVTSVIDSSIGEGAVVRASWLEGATVGAGATVGPFAYLRPQAVLAERSKAGTFVEIKNSRVGVGAKVPHLSYIGDADVGEGTNLGAGTITANYDGREKHRTTIGAGVKGGVHTSLVAPVTIGDDSYTAAGSVVTDEVPAGSLAIARVRQRNIEGYSARRERDATSSR